jgi:hypothetical protein
MAGLSSEAERNLLLLPEKSKVARPLDDYVRLVEVLQ